MGTPLIIDNATTKRLYGHYARILVDMDFSRKMFLEITVEREGYSFNVEVAYEWLPDFCAHCQNIGHDVTVCRWLYPRQDNNAHKQAVTQGKKQAPTKKQIWTPTTENPSGIGSSLAFAGPQQDVTPAMTAAVSPPQEPTAEVPPPTEPTTLVPTYTATAVPAHVTVQQDTLTTNKHQDVQQEITLEVDNSDAHNVADTMEQTSDIPIQAAMVHNTTLSQNFFSVQLNNVTDEIVRTEFINDEPIFTPVRTLDVSSIAADPNAIIDPTLRKEMDFMQTWLDKAAAIEVPFSLVLSKSQKKKLNKQKVDFQTKTRSQGPFPTSK